MKKQLLFIVLAFAVITGYSQSYFEKFIEPEDGVFREAEYVVETEDHGFIISCSARYINQNGMLLKITADGEITNRLIFQINNKDLRYCGLYKNPDQENEYIAIALLVGVINSSYVMTELAFLHLDADLNIISQNICSLDEGYFFYVVNQEKDFPRFELREDGTFLMAAHCYKTDSYCYVFAKIRTDGEIIRMQEDSNFDESVNYLSDLFQRDNGGCGMICWSNKDNGGEFYYTVDSSLNCVKNARLSNTKLKVIQTNPQYPDTTYNYFFPRGTGVAYNDTSFLLTNHTKYLKHSGGKFGFAYFVAKVNDSIDVYDIKIWDIIAQTEPARRVAGVKALSVTDDAIYQCGFNRHNSYGLIYTEPPVPSIITVSKFDKDLNLIWRRYYGANDNIYEINVIQATEDGGCILTGVSAQTPKSNYYLSYVLKLDADGYDSVDENGESIAKPYCCYPNPAHDNIYIEISPDVQCKSIEICTLDGRLVEIFTSTCDLTSINIANLNSGIYILKLKMSEGTEFSERIVKD